MGDLAGPAASGAATVPRGPRSMASGPIDTQTVAGGWGPRPGLAAARKRASSSLLSQHGAMCATHKALVVAAPVSSLKDPDAARRAGLLGNTSKMPWKPAGRRPAAFQPEWECLSNAGISAAVESGRKGYIGTRHRIRVTSVQARAAVLGATRQTRRQLNAGSLGAKFVTPAP